jgi:hypothetical protein
VGYVGLMAMLLPPMFVFMYIHYTRGILDAVYGPITGGWKTFAWQLLTIPLDYSIGEKIFKFIGLEVRETESRG